MKWVKGFAYFFAENGAFYFGIHPVVEGRDCIEKANANFFAQLSRMHHEFRNIWIDGNTSIIEALAHYARNDGTEIVLPVVTIFSFEGEEISEDRIYMDINPFF